MKINRFLATTITSTLLLLLTGVSFYLITGASQKVESITREFVLSLYLGQEVTPEQRASIEEILTAQSQSIQSYEYISAEQAAQEFSKEIEVDFSGLFESSPLPSSYRISLTPTAQIKELEERLQQIEGVSESYYPHELSKEVEAGIEQLSYYILGFGVVLAFVLIIVYYNTIRMDVAASSDRIARALHRRMPINEIRTPFLRRAYAQGTISGVLASIILLIATEVVTLPVEKLNVELSEVIVILAMMIILGMIFSLIFTTFALNRIIRKSLK
ncbi:MAG: permease-like cell division protein FtsX [Rikenellaceae bacterium]